MTQSCSEFIQSTLSRMTLEEKIGQCLTVSWRGSLITPSITEAITRLHVGGLRIEPYSTETALRLYYGRDARWPDFDPPDDYFTLPQTYFQPREHSLQTTPEHYISRLNQLKQLAVSRPSGVPLHICLDHEGGTSHDFPYGGMNFFPRQMGLSAAGDPDLAFRVGRALGRQLAALGVTMLHAPICDINSNPRNPEIGIRAFSDRAEYALEYLSAYWRGIEEGGVAATGKHFPGRGDSACDAHHELDTIRASRETIFSRELLPYRTLIPMGLRAVMIAHSAYPALEPEAIPATMSKRIITGVLREELGFQGVITTDAMGMGAIVKHWGIPRAAVRALQAGVNLLLLKHDDEVRTQTFFEIRRAVESGELTEGTLDQSVGYVLKMKYDQGLFADGGARDPDTAVKVLADPEIRDTAAEAARRAVTLLRNDAVTIPLRPGTPVLVVEQLDTCLSNPNNAFYHAHSLNEAVLRRSTAAVPADVSFVPTPKETELILRLSEAAEVVILTNYTAHGTEGCAGDLIRALIAKGKKTVVIAESPFLENEIPEAPAVLIHFGLTPEACEAVTAVLYGEHPATGRLPLHSPPTR